LVIEVIIGAAAYVPASLILCREMARDFFSWMKRGLGRSTQTEAA
jgi:hypothetical protein